MKRILMVCAVASMVAAFVMSSSHNVWAAAYIQLPINQGETGATTGETTDTSHGKFRVISPNTSGVKGHLNVKVPTVHVAPPRISH